MLPKAYRLPSSDISRVMRSGKRIVGSGITLIFHTPTASKASVQSMSRFSFIVSKNVDKRATVRNRIKRVLAESVRHILPDMSRPVDAVVVGSKQLVGLAQAEVEKRMTEVFKRL